MSTDETNLGARIRVEVKSLYLSHQSKPEENHFVFSYTISIFNTGDASAKLLTRHWLITDADGHKQEVHGDGIVGEQPEIQPGEKYVYSSGAVIETPVGTMEGRYGMVNPAGDNFDALIPVFRLAVPGVLN
jgi:ApaG protein